MGDSHYENGKLDEAITYIKKGLALDNNDLQAHMILGQIYFDKGDFTSAVSSYEKVINTTNSLKPNSHANIDKILIYNPYLPKAHYNLSIAHYYKMNYEKAWEHARLAEKFGLNISDLKKKLKKVSKKSGPS